MLAYIKDDDEEGLDDFCLANVSRRSFVPKSKRSFGRESKHSFLPEMCGKESEK
jgi:hypothetical protein